MLFSNVYQWVYAATWGPPAEQHISLIINEPPRNITTD